MHSSCKNVFAWTFGSTVFVDFLCQYFRLCEKKQRLQTENDVKTNTRKFLMHCAISTPLHPCCIKTMHFGLCILLLLNVWRWQKNASFRYRHAMLKRGNWFILGEIRHAKTIYAHWVFALWKQQNEEAIILFLLVWRTLNTEEPKSKAWDHGFVFVEMFRRPKKGIANFLFTIRITRARNIMTSLLF